MVIFWDRVYKVHHSLKITKIKIIDLQKINIDLTNKINLAENFASIREKKNIPVCLWWGANHQPWNLESDVLSTAPRRPGVREKMYSRTQLSRSLHNV